MKRLDNMTPNQYQALGELRRRLFDEFDIEALILYDSVARGEADEESNLDLLIVTAQPLTRPARHEITDMVLDERELRSQLRSAAEVVFAKLWDNEEDEVWNEYLWATRGAGRRKLSSAMSFDFVGY